MKRIQRGPVRGISLKLQASPAVATRLSSQPSCLFRLTAAAVRMKNHCMLPRQWRGVQCHKRQWRGVQLQPHIMYKLVFP